MDRLRFMLEASHRRISNGGRKILVFWGFLLDHPVDPCHSAQKYIYTTVYNYDMYWVLLERMWHTVRESKFVPSPCNDENGLQLLQCFTSKIDLYFIFTLFDSCQSLRPFFEFTKLEITAVKWKRKMPVKVWISEFIRRMQRSAG